MTVISALVVLGVLVAFALLAACFGADSRPQDPDCYEPQWPFHRREG